MKKCTWLLMLLMLLALCLALTGCGPKSEESSNVQRQADVYAAVVDDRAVTLTKQGDHYTLTAEGEANTLELDYQWGVADQQICVRLGAREYLVSLKDSKADTMSIVSSGLRPAEGSLAQEQDIRLTMEGESAACFIRYDDETLLYWDESDTERITCTRDPDWKDGRRYRAGAFAAIWLTDDGDVKFIRENQPIGDGSIQIIVDGDQAELVVVTGETWTQYADGTEVHEPGGARIPVGAVIRSEDSYTLRMSVTADGHHEEIVLKKQ